MPGGQRVFGEKLEGEANSVLCGAAKTCPAARSAYGPLIAGSRSAKIGKEGKNESAICYAMFDQNIRTCRRERDTELNTLQPREGR